MHTSLSLLALLCVSACTSASVPSIFRRQLPVGLTCGASDLSTGLAGLPTTCRESLTAFVAIRPEQYVTRQAEVFQAIQVICSSECLPPVVDLVDICLPPYRTSLGQACASNGLFQCWQGPIINNGTDVNIDCYDTLTSNDTCPEECQDSIMTIRDDLGCCVNNVFNTTVFGPALAQLRVANGTLWDACGVDRVLFCPVPEVLSTQSSVTDNATGHLVNVAIILQAAVLAFGSVLM